MSTKITGASDDLVELDGDLDEEFNWFADDDERYLGFSDGTILGVRYDEDALWRFSVKVKGDLYDKKIEGNVEDDKCDEVHFEDGLKWCVFGEQSCINKK